MNMFMFALPVDDIGIIVCKKKRKKGGTKEGRWEGMEEGREEEREERREGKRVPGHGARNDQRKISIDSIGNLHIVFLKESAKILSLFEWQAG